MKTKAQKLVYVVTDTGSRDRIIAYEWLAEGMVQRGYNVSFVILKGHAFLRKFLDRKNIPYLNLNYSVTTRLQLIKATLKVCRLFLTLRPHIVHTHYYDANILGLLAAKLTGVKKRMFTRHHGAGYHLYAPENVKNDLRLNNLATDVIAVSKIVLDILINREKTNPNKIHLIHHGFDFSVMEKVETKEINSLKTKYGLKGHPVIGAMSSYHKLKGVEYIIRAFKRLLTDFPNAILVLANAYGENKQAIEQELMDIPAGNIVEISYENNAYALMKTFDVFVHAPIHPEVEAFGQVYIEAMVCEVPGVFTMAGIAPEFIRHNENALVVPAENEQAIYSAIKIYLVDKELKNRITINAKHSVTELFNLETMLDRLDKLYRKN